MHDPLTKLFNRNGLNQLFTKELKRSNYYSEPISIIMLDVDLLKQVNDRYGHQIGDKVLKRVAKIVLSVTREEDIKVTISIGVRSILNGDKNKQNALNKVDKALYMAKKLGRNQVVSIQPLRSGKQHLNFEHFFTKNFVIASITKHRLIPH
ncbi:MAG: GGDEF domain-containing protein [Legionellaceae bacterium]|nr:GGDEF domain-containing protein [Legionellaceae bacterium]